MAMNIDQLRKHYDKLTPYERASMQCEAAKNLDDALSDALQSPGLWEAYHEATYREAFVIIGLAALHESQKQESAHFSAAYMAFNILGGCLLKVNITPDDEIDEIFQDKIDYYIEVRDLTAKKQVAWILALKAFDDEMGAACVASIHSLAGEYIERVLGQDDNSEIDCSFEVSVLRRYWHSLMLYKKDAPRVAGPMYQDEAERSDMN